MTQDAAPDRPQKTVCAIVVLYNGAGFIRRCVEALTEDPSVSTILVLDNKSTDDGPTICQDLPVNLIRLSRNYGFGRANNIGILWAMDRGYDYVYLVNQDVYIGDDAVGALVSEHTRSGSRDCVMSSVQMSGDFSDIDFNFRHYLQGQLGGEDYDRIASGARDTAFLTGRFFNAAAWLVPGRVVKKVGLFDPLFPHYREDEDYAARCAIWSVPMLVSPASRVAHDRDQSGFVALETRPFNKQIERTYVRQIATIKEVRRPLIKSLGIFLKFFVSRLVLSVSKRLPRHAWAVTLGTGRTLREFPAILRHRKRSLSPGAFVDETRILMAREGVRDP